MTKPIFKKMYANALVPGQKIFSTWGVQEVTRSLDKGIGTLVSYKQGSTGDQEFEKFFEYDDEVTVLND